MLMGSIDLLFYDRDQDQTLWYCFDRLHGLIDSGLSHIYFLFVQEYSPQLYCPFRSHISYQRDSQPHQDDE